MTPEVSDQGFMERLNAGAPVDVDEETASKLRAALAELGTPISHEEMKRQLGLGGETR
ncbi:MAG: hypothetical protein M9913_20570 [Bryobacteraceae bacterium]|nr:hypothetical protein [Solibacteraceae bacterium]MCL4844399.1 hypothetical protein [Bryobacteraceae bacterium]MCO5353242.1 hypothetical protein [Bryobacteraceae bacterium]